MYFCKELIYLSPVTTINISLASFFLGYVKRIHAWVFLKKVKKLHILSFSASFK